MVEIDDPELNNIPSNNMKKEKKKLVLSGTKIIKMKEGPGKSENKKVRDLIEEQQKQKQNNQPLLKDNTSSLKRDNNKGFVDLITKNSIIYANNGWKRFKCPQDDILIAVPALDDDNNLIFKCQLHEKELEIEQVYFEPRYNNTNRKVRKALLFFYATCPVCVKNDRYYSQQKDENCGPTHIVTMKPMVDRKI